MQDDQLSKLLTKIVSKTATEQELALFQQLLQENPQEQYSVELLLAYWNESQPNEIITPTAIDEKVDKIFQAEDLPQQENDSLPFEEPVLTPQYKILKFSAIAASIIFIAVGIFIWKHQAKAPENTANKEKEEHKVVVNKGTRTRMQLPDGSIVYINGGSKISYANNFNITNREVYLDGEAYFDVAKNKEKPFVVHTNGIDIKVLGTVFNVKAYTADSLVEATLLEGSIQVFQPQQNGAPLVTLKPNEKIVYYNKWVVSNNAKSTNTIKAVMQNGVLYTEPLVRSSIDSLYKEVSWVYNKLLIEDESFYDVVAKMERWFNVEIQLTEKAYFTKRLRLVFEQESIEEALQAISIVLPIKYSITNNKIVISKP